MTDQVKCTQCPTMMDWDKTHRVEFKPGKETVLCDACCPNCFVSPHPRVVTIP